MMRFLNNCAVCTRIVSDFPIEEPVHDQVVGLAWFELWGHVASAVHGTEGEVALVRLPVSGYLAFDHVSLPLAGLVPAERGDPVLGANGRHGAISVAGVVHHLDLASEGLVDPLGGLGLADVVDV